MYPVTCPNRCQEIPFERQDIEKHVKDECPLTPVSCQFHYAGCEVRLPRRDMPEHMKDTVTHLTLLATVTQRMHQNIEDLKNENQELQQKMHLLEEKQKATEKEVQILREETVRLTTGALPVDFLIRYEKKREIIYSPSFYTHSSGYRMCIGLYPNGNENGKGTHVSIFTYLMQGPYDDHLKWPFRGEITVQMVNQAGDHSHIDETIPYNDKTPDDTSDRVVGEERGNGWGFMISYLSLIFPTMPKITPNI